MTARRNKRGWPTNAARKAARKRFKVHLLRDQAGLCHWCARPIRIYVFEPRVKLFPDDTATFDHLDDRFSPERGKHAGKIRTVLACHPCNHERGRQSQAAQPLAELHRRAAHHAEGAPA